MKVEEIVDPVYGKCVHITNGVIQATVTVDVGPRILEFGFCEGENILYRDTEKKYKVPVQTSVKGKVSAVFFPYGGHRLWLSPGYSEKTLYPDNFPVVYSILPDGVLFTPPVQKTTEIRPGFEIVMGKDAADIMVVHTAENCSKEVKTCGLWPVTMVKGGGLAVIPQNMDGPNPYRASRAVVFWPKTDIRDRRIFYGNRFITVRHIKGEAAPLKLGCNDVTGWVGYVGQKYTLIKRFVFNPQAVYPDFGSSCEICLEPDFAEIQSFSPLYRIKPGETIKYVENLSVYHIAHPEAMDSEDSIAEYFNNLT